jgi:hypothetical protein
MSEQDDSNQIKYDPATGRFVNEDPLQFAAGDPNLYRYIFNGPTNGTDPLGMGPFGIFPRWCGRDCYPSQPPPPSYIQYRRSYYRPPGQLSQEEIEALWPKQEPPWGFQPTPGYEPRMRMPSGRNQPNGPIRGLLFRFGGQSRQRGGLLWSWDVDYIIIIGPSPPPP